MPRSPLTAGGWLGGGGGRGRTAGDGARGEEAAVGRVDDGVEAPDAEHAEVRDGERGAAHVGRWHPARPRLADHALDLRDEVRELAGGRGGGRRDEQTPRGG